VLDCTLLNSISKCFSCQTKQNPHTSSLSPGSCVLVISLCTRTAVRFACNWKYTPIRCTHWGAEQGQIMRHSTCLTSDKQINKCGSVDRLVTTRLLTGRPILYLFSTRCGAHQVCYSMGIWGPGSGTEYSPSLEVRMGMSGAMPLFPPTRTSLSGQRQQHVCMILTVNSNSLSVLCNAEAVCFLLVR